MSGALTTHLRRMWRVALTTESLLSEDEAVEALPGRPEATRPWLRDQVAPAGAIGSDPVFRWGDVLTALKSPAAEPALASCDEVAQRLGVSRRTLDAMVARAPATLPGAPVAVGSGGRRKHLRWRLAHVEAWLQAYQAWESEQVRSCQPSAPRRRSARRSSDAPVDWSAVGRAESGRR